MTSVVLGWKWLCNQFCKESRVGRPNLPVQRQQ
jgi:hypothetical protein